MTDIEQIEQLEKNIDNLIKEQEEREKYIHKLEEKLMYALNPVPNRELAENPKEIKNEAFIYCIDKNGNKVKVPFDKKIVLKEGDRIEQFGEKYYLFRKIEE